MCKTCGAVVLAMRVSIPVFQITATHSLSASRTSNAHYQFSLPPFLSSIPLLNPPDRHSLAPLPPETRRYRNGLYYALS
ncbi:hypothetical protein EDD21DRAFT_385374 [Dissophora ornata]|nr:hypothetical protein EDD21DRAFT_385374 [Dissophora ornata]